MTGDEGTASRTQKLVTAAGRARLDSDTMRRWTVEVAEAVAATQERLAATLDRLADHYGRRHMAVRGERMAWSGLRHRLRIASLRVGLNRGHAIAAGRLPLELCDSRLNFRLVVVRVERSAIHGDCPIRLIRVLIELPELGRGDMIVGSHAQRALEQLL